MSQRTKKKRRLTLQITVIALVASWLSACTAPAPKPMQQTKVMASKSLEYVRTIDKLGHGGSDLFKQIIAGDDYIRLRRPVAIDLRDDYMLIADRGDLIEHAGMHTILPEDRRLLKESLPHSENRIRNENIAVASAQVTAEDYNRGVIFKLDLKSGRINVVQGAGDKVHDEISDIHIGEDHSFYVTDVEGRRALQFSPKGKLLKVYQHPPNIYRPIAITVDEKNNEVIVADEMYSHIVSFDKEKAIPKYGMGARGEGPGKFRIITDMIAIPDGYLVSDRIELRVQVLDKQGNYIADFGRADLMFPTALAMDKFGRVYVADKSDSTIKVYKAGKLMEKIGRNGYGPMEFRYISDMKIHKDQLYVVDSLNSRIQIFNIIPEGNKVASIH